MKRWILPITLAVLISSVGCSESITPKKEDSLSESVTEAKFDENTDESEYTTEEAAEAKMKTVFTSDSSEMFTNRDYEVGYDESATYNITLSGETAYTDTDKAVVSGSTITITGDGTYIISGSLSDGMIIVDANEKAKPQLVLSGVNITSETSAPIYIKSCNKVFITIADSTENTLTNGGSFSQIDENNIDAVIFSKEDITLNGSGSLNINSPVGHGIVGKDDVAITSGNFVIESSSHGINANNSVRLANADISIVSGKDGIHAEHPNDSALGFIYALSGRYTINSEGDGVSAGSYIQAVDGEYSIVSGGGSENAEERQDDMFGGGFGGGFGGLGGGRPGRDGGFMPTSDTETTTETEDTTTSTKGIKASSDILIGGGNWSIDSADDSVHSNTSVTIDGGIFTIESGDDGIHADESLTINDGEIEITESYEGLEALDILISGGEINITSSDDGLNAAGGTDESGFGGFGGGSDTFGRPGGGHGGGMSSGNGSIVITDGELYIKASGDGIDANGTLEISGGNVTVCGPTQGDTAVLDYDKTAVITGGKFIGTGSQMMAQSFSSSEQGVIAVSVDEQSAGTLITVTDVKGKEIMTVEPVLNFQIVILSSKKIKSGETYTLTIGEQSGEVTAE